jgi:Protein of unknown function DUF115
VVEHPNGGELVMTEERGIVAQMEEAYGDFKRLGGLATHAATPSEESFENIRVNGRRGLPKFEDLPGFNAPKGWPVALAGGGPSIKRHLDELRSAPTIISCGSSHDYLIEQGIIPTFAVACDPDPITQAYFQNPCQKTIFLLSKHCHPDLYEHLKDYRIVTWNCFMDDPRAAEILIETDGPNWHAIAGGCTVGLRSISIAMMLGFKDIHFFGFDSCVEQIEGGYAHHAYQYATDKEQMQEVFTVKCGTDRPGDKTYFCEGYQLAQAFHFKQFVTAHGHLFRAYFYGGGMLSDWYDTYLTGVARAVERLSPEERARYEKEMAR